MTKKIEYEMLAKAFKKLETEVIALRWALTEIQVRSSTLEAAKARATRALAGAD